MKHYFFVSNIRAKLPGVEKAVIKRHQLFQEMNEQSIICTTKFNTNLHEHGEIHRIRSQSLLNLYRYYQKLPEVQQDFTFEKLVEQYPKWRFERVRDTQDYRVYDQDDKYIVYLSCYPNGRVYYLNFINQFKKKYKRCIYDEYGNLASETFLDQQYQVIYERYLNSGGQSVIEVFNHFEDKKKIVSAIHLYRNGETFIFTSMDEFLAHWLDDLALEKECIFFIDRNGEYGNAINLMKESVPIYSVLHSLHAQEAGKNIHGKLNHRYEQFFTNYERYSALIVSTNLQKKHVEDRFQKAFPTLVVPVGYTEKRPLVAMADRTPNRIVIPSRFSGEKQLHLLIEMIAQVKEQIPNVSVHLFGFNSSPVDVKGQMEKKIAEQSLQEHFVFHDFTNDVYKELDDATAYILTSKGEGFCLTLLEALNCGVPSLAFDVPYGPSDMIQHNLNGFLISPFDTQQMANALVTLLQDEHLKQRMSNSAYEWSGLFNKEAIQEKWENIINQHKKNV